MIGPLISPKTILAVAVAGECLDLLLEGVVIVGERFRLSPFRMRALLLSAAAVLLSPPPTVSSSDCVAITSLAWMLAEAPSPVSLTVVV